MNKIFMGKPIHWLMIIIATAIIFSCGLKNLNIIKTLLGQLITPQKDL